MSDNEEPRMDPALWRGLTQRRLSRRDALKAAGVGAGALSLGAIMAACGVSGTQNAQVNSDVGSPAWWDKQTLAKTMVFANWPLYIDKASKGHYPSIELFTRTTGIQVTYKVPIQDNPGFYAQIAPVLKSKQPIGDDIIVLTNNSPVLGKVIHTNGWAIPLDQRKMTTFYANAAAPIKDPSWDPGNKYTMAWQSGLTAIGYDPTKTGREITSVNDLFDPTFKGHVGMFSDPQELGTLGLLAIGVDPATSTPADWQKAADKLMQQRPLVRSYYDQSYIDALSSGEIWITQAWSGDIFQTNKANGNEALKMAVPQEGGMLWTDNILIPLYAEHPIDAMTYMDFVYRPDEGGIIADAVTYITPVAAAQTYIRDTLHDPVAANSPLIFPDAATAAKFKHYYIYKDQADLDAWNNIFEPITTG